MAKSIGAAVSLSTHRIALISLACVRQLMERIFNGPTGPNLLIPRGARLTGSYDNVVVFGHKRALLLATLPDELR